MTHPQGHTETKPRPTEVPVAGGGSSPDPAATLAAQLVDTDPFDSDMTTRLRIACRGESVAVLSLKLGLNRESIRRMIQTGRPTARFLHGLCRHYGADAHWLITGEGPELRAGRAIAALGDAATEELVAEVSRRVGRLLSTLERSGAAAAGPGPPSGHGAAC